MKRLHSHWFEDCGTLEDVPKFDVPFLMGNNFLYCCPNSWCVFGWGGGEKGKGKRCGGTRKKKKNRGKEKGEEK